MASRSFRRFDVETDVLNYQIEYNTDETAELRSALKEKLSVSLDDLRRVALWKLDRVLNVPHVLIKELGNLATAKDLTAESEQSRKAIEALVACKGVHFPMASAFLKFLRPDIFPIIDVRAYRALTGKKLGCNSYNVDLYLEYVARIRKIARELGKNLSEVDEQLYCFDRKHNGTINS